MNIKKSALVASALFVTGAAQAEVSANLGFASEYYYRGIFQAESSASAGIDFEKSGFYAGTWAADVGDGLEVDGYFGYGAEVSGVDLSIGYTGYFYTGDFDNTYQEINLGGSFGLLTLDVAIGKYDLNNWTTQDYTFVSLTLEKDGFYGKFGTFSKDFSGDYFEAGYSATVAEIDLGVTLIFNDNDLSGSGESDEAIVFTIGKAFDIN